jgi:D-3-phosphoglycerate dehydrogenase / 2-oxoglutarate reductase
VPKRIVISTSSFDVPASQALETLARNGFEIVLNPYGRRLNEAEAGGLIETDVVGLIAGVEPLTRAVITRARHLKVISRCGIGMDNVDLAATAEKGIWVRNTPDAPGKAVAELTIGLMLNLLRNVSEADRRIRSNDWKQLMGGLLSAQTVGLIGYGRIGRRVARLLAAFDATVLVYDKFMPPEDRNAEFRPLDALLAHADIVSLHVPYEPDTHHLLNEQRMSAMKKGALVINASRGGLIDEAALLKLLLSGHLGGAALDCFEVEPYSGPLAGVERVVLTAHMGSYAREARALMEREAADNLLQGLTEQGCLAV